MSISRPNIVQQENRLRTLPDEALRAMLLQMGQAGQVGSPEYLLAAGEMQTRRKVREQAQMGQPQQPPVIAELLTGVQAPQQPMPAEAGVAALPVQNLENLDQPKYADGGIVAFSGGASVRNPFLVDEMDALDRMTPEERKEYYRKKFQAREGATPRSSTSPFPARRAPGVMGLAGRAASVFGPALTLGWDQLYGTSDEDMDKLRAFDTAKERLKAAGFTDKDIDAMPRETVYRMASGYQPEARQVAGPSTPGDLRRLEAAAKDPYVTGPGLTPAQSAANIAAAGGQGGAGNANPAPTGGGLYGQVEDFMRRFYPASTEKAPTAAEAIAQERAALEAAGVDLDPNKELREQIMAERAGRAGDREKAGWQSLAQFGLTLASTPGDFLTAVGKAGLPALQAYSGEIKELKKLAREDDRLINQLNAADNQLKLGITQKGLDRRDKIVERIENKRDKAGTIAASVFGGLASLEGAKEGRAETRQDARIRNAQDQARRIVEAQVRSNPRLAMDPNFDFEGAVDAAAARILQSYEPGRAGAQPTGMPSQSAIAAEMKRRGLQ